MIKFEGNTEYLEGPRPTVRAETYLDGIAQTEAKYKPLVETSKKLFTLYTAGPEATDAWNEWVAALRTVTDDV